MIRPGLTASKIRQWPELSAAAKSRPWPINRNFRNVCETRELGLSGIAVLDRRRMSRKEVVGQLAEAGIAADAPETAIESVSSVTARALPHAASNGGAAT
jgi:hypothetical protein